MVAGMNPASEIQEVEIRHSCQRLVGRMSISLSESAGVAQRRDLEGMVRRVDASRQLKHAILSLKDRIARRAAGRPTLACDDNTVELVYKAS